MKWTRSKVEGGHAFDFGSWRQSARKTAAGPIGAVTEEQPGRDAIQSTGTSRLLPEHGRVGNGGIGSWLLLRVSA